MSHSIHAFALTVCTIAVGSVVPASVRDASGDEGAITLASAEVANSEYRIPLSEAGQSGICLHGDHLFLTVHSKLEGPMKGGFYYNGNIVGQCFDKNSGKLLWQAELPGTYDGRVLESWHDSTSLVPVADDEHVVFHNLNGMLACYAHDGKLLWKRTWQAPDPDIKNCRMFLRGSQLIVAMVSDKIAVAESKKHPALPFYQIHSIDIASGKDLWVSPVLLTHATQYGIDQWKGESVIVASMIDLSHWKFKQGRHGYFISLKDGQPIQSFPLPPAIPHQKNQLCGGKFVVTVEAKSETTFQLVDPVTTKTTAEFRFEKPDQYFAWTGSQFEEATFEPEFKDRTLRSKGRPTPSTVHVVGDRIYFWRYNSGDIGCIETSTGRSILVEVPMQVLRDKIVWNKEDFQFTKGILNSSGRNINSRVGSVRGIQRGGFGHTNPAWPVLRENRLYWQGGAGVLYIIDVTQPFTPKAITCKSIDEKGSAWTFGAPAVDDEFIYVRSQQELVKFAK